MLEPLLAPARGPRHKTGMPQPPNGKFLITGASGFIGTRLRDALTEGGADVVAIRRPGSPPAKAGRSVEASYDDVERLTQIAKEEKPEYVLHVAGVTKGRTYDDFRRGNVVPTEHLLAALRAGHPEVKRFVHVSSLAAYGPSAPERPLKETDPRKPIEYYGESKLEAEEVVEREEQIPWTIIRPAGVYGPGDVDYFNLFQTAVKGWNVFFGNRDRWQSIIYVDDCVRSILEAAAHAETPGRGYFLAQKQDVTWGQFQDEILDVVAKPTRTVNLPESLVTLAALGGELATRFDKKPRLLNLQKAKMGAQEAWTCDADAAERDFGFRTEVDLKDGIRRTHEWYAEHDWY